METPVAIMKREREDSQGYFRLQGGGAPSSH
jgi:hypothetical protein